MLRQKKPIFEDRNRLDIAAYMGPRRGGKHLWEGGYGGYPLDPEEGYPDFFTDEIFELYRDAGLNILLPEGDAFYGTRVTKEGFCSEPDFEKSDLYTYMVMAEKYGLYVYPSIEKFFTYIARGEGKLQECDRQELKKFVETLQKYFPDTFKGILLTDEPPYYAFDNIKEIKQYLDSNEIADIKSSIDIFTSMHPIYAPLNLLHEGYTEPKYQRLRYDKDRIKAYQSYMEKTAEAVGEISFDHYPFIYQNQLTPGFYENLEMAAEHGKKVNCPISVTIQSFQLDEVQNVTTCRKSVVWRSPTYNEARWQLYSALAFGVRRIGYYTFWTHYALGKKNVQTDAMIVFDPSEEKGYRKTQLYDLIKEVNHEVLEFDHVFLQYDWQGCKIIRKSRDANIRRVKGGYEKGCIKSAEATRDCLIGCMQHHEDKTEAYWIVNAENPSHDQINDIRIVFEGADRVLYYRKGKEHDVSLENAEFCLRLGVGEGIFVIPYSTKDIMEGNHE